jgi:prepilin-type N-terminal cleavage/methylation domain-containing protein
MRAFTLIEVLISVMIITFAAFTFLSFSSNSFKLFEKFKKRNDFLLKSSLVFCEERGGRLNEVVRDFNIKNDKILTLLKKYKINLKTITTKDKFVLKTLIAKDKEHQARVYSIDR